MPVSQPQPVLHTAGGHHRPDHRKERLAPVPGIMTNVQSNFTTRWNNNLVNKYTMDFLLVKNFIIVFFHLHRYWTHTHKSIIFICRVSKSELYGGMRCAKNNLFELKFVLIFHFFCFMHYFPFYGTFGSTLCTNAFNQRIMPVQRKSLLESLFLC